MRFYTSIGFPQLLQACLGFVLLSALFYINQLFTCLSLSFYNGVLCGFCLLCFASLRFDFHLHLHLHKMYKFPLLSPLTRIYQKRTNKFYLIISRTKTNCIYFLLYFLLCAENSIYLYVLWAYAALLTFNLSLTCKRNHTQS